jgi:O-antigen ligase
VSGLIAPTILGLWQVISGSSQESTFLGLSFQDAQTAGTAVVEIGSSRILRAYGSFPHPNIFGGFVAIGLLSLSWLVYKIENKRQFLFLIIPAIFLPVALVITFSRGAWLAATAGFIFIVGLISLLSTLILFFPQVSARFEPSLRVEKISIEERASQYSWFDDVFKHNPLFGVGPGAYTFALNAIDPEKNVWGYQPIHNTFLLILGEIGVLGLAAFIYFILRVDQISARVSKKIEGVFGLSFGIALLTLALFDHYLWSLWPGLALGVFGISLIIQLSRHT